MVNGREDFGFDFGQRALNAGSGGELVPASAEESADFADVDFGIFGTKADADFAFGKFFDEGGDDDAFDGTDGVDEALVVLGQDAERGARGLGEGEAGDAIVAGELEDVEQCAEEFEPAARVALVHLL